MPLVVVEAMVFQHVLHSHRPVGHASRIQADTVNNPVAETEATADEPVTIALAKIDFYFREIKVSKG